MGVMTENAADLQACAVLEYRAKDAEEFKSLAMWLKGQGMDFRPQVLAGTDDDGPVTALAELEVEDDGLGAAINSVCDILNPDAVGNVHRRAVEHLAQLGI